MNDLSQFDFKKKLAENILKHRKKLNLSQEELAHRIGKDKQFINRYEVQGANPTAFTLKKLADALGVTPNDLLDF